MKRTASSRSARIGAACALVALLAGCGTAVGCSNVLGLDRYEVGDSPSNGGNAGVAGDGGTTGGSGGTAGGSGGTTGGAAGSGGQTFNCDGVPAPNEDVIRSCLLRISCSPFVSNVSLSTCVSVNYQRAFLGTSCTLAARTCDAIETCLGYGYADAECVGHTGIRCENNVAYNCNNNYYVDCSTRGGTCVLYDSNNDNIDDTADCKVLDCADPNGTSKCQGNTYYTCVDGEGIGAACSAVQAECRTQGGQSNCFLKTGATCTQSGLVCEGDTAKLCTGGTALEFDCASVGLGCSDDLTGTYCVAPGCTTEQANACKESCSAGVISMCYGGVRHDVDCKQYGFSACRMVPDPTPNADPYAVCN